MNYVKQILTDRNIKKARRSAKSLKRKSIRLPDLPRPFIPASNGRFRELFYWDSFFIMQGLNIKGRRRKKIIKNMVEDFFFLFDKYGYIPNSYPTNDTRTQPPFLSSMVLMVYEHFQDKKWLEKAYKIIAREYKEVWMSKPRLTPTGLSRYYDPTHPKGEAINAEDESGWDFTPRFEGKAHQVCPIDLNALLFKYETDLSRIAIELGKEKEADEWEKASGKRKKMINQFMWNEKTGFFFDYNFIDQKPLNTKTLAAFVPLWTKLATQKQAGQLVKKLKWFEQEGGLSTTDQGYVIQEQWSYPNGWPPLQWLVINGLKNYGYHQDAERLTYKWLKLCADEFVKEGQWHEKLCVVPGLKRTEDRRYEHQTEQYWTAAVFLSLYYQITKK